MTMPSSEVIREWRRQTSTWLDDRSSDDAVSVCLRVGGKCNQVEAEKRERGCEPASWVRAEKEEKKQ
jgi:hypothetical protein